MGKDKKDCPSCSGNGGSWQLVDPVRPTKNGQQQRGQQKWVKCGACGGSGNA